MSVKKDDIEIEYLYQKEDDYSDYKIIIRLKNGGGILMKHGDENKFELIPRKVLPVLGGKTYGSGFVLDNEMDKESDDKLIIKCTDGDIVLTPEQIKENADKQ